MTASRSGSPLLRSPLRVKCARLTDPGLMSSAELESVEFLLDIASTALQLDLQAAAARMRAEEWVKRGSDSSLVCALCDVTPVSYRVTNFPTHVGR